MNAADEPIADLDTLFVPEPGAAFWADLHTRLATSGDPGVRLADEAGDHAPGGEVEIRDITSGRSSSSRRRALAAAAVLALVVAGLAAVRLDRDEQRPADRVDLVIDDPLRIDLDGMRRDGLGWEPEPSGPYQVFDLSTLDRDVWTADASGYDIADTRGTWDWRWTGTIRSVTDRPSAWQLEVAAPETAELAVPDGDPVVVRGVPGTMRDDEYPEIVWLERGTRVVLRWVSADAAFDLEAGLALADDLSAIETDQLVIDQMQFEGPYRRSDVTLLGGTLGGLDWWIDVSPDPDSGAEEQLSIVVEGMQVAAGGGPNGTPVRITSTLPFGLGRLLAGRVERDLEAVVVQLSDGTLVTMPVHDDGDTTVWAVPVPIGLDVVFVQLVAPGGTDVDAIRVPIHLDQVGASVTTG